MNVRKAEKYQSSENNWQERNMTYERNPSHKNFHYKMISNLNSGFQTGRKKTLTQSKIFNWTRSF